MPPDVIHGKPNKNAGKESWKHIGFYPSLKLALVASGGAFQHMMNDTENSSVQEMIDKIESAKTEVIEALKRDEE